MLRMSASTTARYAKACLVHVCARHERDWASYGTAIVGTKRQPQPTNFEGKAPDS